MKNLKEMSINEIKTELLEIFDEETTEEMLDIYSIEELVDIIEKEKASIIDTDSTEPSKHTPSRKKKIKRIMQHKPKESYKKDKKGDWAKHTRKKIKDSETTNRTFINKASRSYTPNRTQKH